MGLEISVMNRNRAARVDTKFLQRVAARVVELEREDAGLNLGALEIALVDDAAIAKINVEFLGHDGPTDVISFLYPADAAGGAKGELIVSTQRAAAQAAEWGNPVWAEVALYVTHGILHLSGYRDATAAQKARMRRREREVMGKLRKEFALAKLLR